jgi:UDP-N-acetylglucosamine--N-acetylmuramyl-(pentapeptide) pyrophosphoryl-undecaprenol N-acetylglucosamine transferase
MINRIVFAAGGTGGHIYPAIAVADELRKMNEKIEIRFIGAKGKIEEKIVPKMGYELETIEISGFKRSMSIKNISAAFKLMKALSDSKKILSDFKPEIVFGTGGYVSGPVLRSARKLGIPTVIEEGNYYPGVTVKLVAPKADRVIVNFEGTKKFLKREDNVTTISYPIRTNMKRINRSEAAGMLGLDPQKKILLAFGGSQGARSINNALLKSFGNINGKGIQIIWQTGEGDFEIVSSAAKSSKVTKVLKYIDNIRTAYSACDLIVCRSGISTIMELAAFGSAAVFVPFPQASENHQVKNAKAITEKNAAEMILDKELDEKLEKTVLELIRDENRLAEMSRNIRQFADIDAANKIAQLLVDMVNKSKN